MCPCVVHAVRSAQRTHTSPLMLHILNRFVYTYIDYIKSISIGLSINSHLILGLYTKQNKYPTRTSVYTSIRSHLWNFNDTFLFVCLCFVLVVSYTTETIWSFSSLLFHSSRAYLLIKGQFNKSKINYLRNGLKSIYTQTHTHTYTSSFFLLHLFLFITYYINNNIRIVSSTIHNFFLL